MIMAIHIGFYFMLFADAKLCMWFKSQRTRYSKLTQLENKSGSGSRVLTARQQWITDKWSFIKSHIVRVEGRQSTKKVIIMK